VTANVLVWNGRVARPAPTEHEAVAGQRTPASPTRPQRVEPDRKARGAGLEQRKTLLETGTSLDG